MSLIAVKDEDPDSDEEEPKKTNPRILGLGLMAGAGCFLTIGNVIVQYTHKKWPSKVSTFEVLFIRSFIQTLFIVAFMTYGKVSVYGNCLRNLIVLSIMGIAEVAAIVCVYFALERIPVGDATVIQFTAPVFTVAFSFLCLRKGCGILDTVCGVISFGGVIVLARPTILFSHKEHNAHVVGGGIVLAATSLIAINRTVFARIEACQNLGKKAEDDDTRFPLLIKDETEVKKRFHSKNTL
eukprot:gene6354-11788_t